MAAVRESRRNARLAFFRLCRFGSVQCLSVCLYVCMCGKLLLLLMLLMRPIEPVSIRPFFYIFFRRNPPEKKCFHLVVCRFSLGKTFCPLPLHKFQLENENRHSAVHRNIKGHPNDLIMCPLPPSLSLCFHPLCFPNCLSPGEPCETVFFFIRTPVDILKNKLPARGFRRRRR